MAEGEEGPSFLQKYVTGTPPPKKIVIILLSELIGTFWLEYLGCLTLIIGFSLLQVAVGWGFIVGIIVQILGPISGSHLNPGVTIAHIILGKTSVVMAILYMIMQFIGAILGMLCLKVCLSATIYNKSSVIVRGQNVGMCCTIPAEGITGVQAALIEYLATGFLIAIVCSIHDPRNRFYKDSMPLKVAGCIIADVICIGPLTGASLNTARSFAPALLNNAWQKHWAYWVGPLAASITVPLIYLFVFQADVEPDNSGKTATTEELIAKLRNA